MARLSRFLVCCTRDRQTGGKNEGRKVPGTLLHIRCKREMFAAMQDPRKIESLQKLNVVLNSHVLRKPPSRTSKYYPSLHSLARKRLLLLWAHIQFAAFFTQQQHRKKILRKRIRVSASRGFLSRSPATFPSDRSCVTSRRG